MYTCAIYFTTLKSDNRECYILLSGLAVLAMQVECMQVGFHTVLNHSVVKTQGLAKAISQKSYCFK